LCRRTEVRNGIRRWRTWCLRCGWESECGWESGRVQSCSNQIGHHASCHLQGIGRCCTCRRGCCVCHRGCPASGRCCICHRGCPAPTTRTRSAAVAIPMVISATAVALPIGRRCPARWTPAIAIALPMIASAICHRDCNCPAIIVIAIASSSIVIAIAIASSSIVAIAFMSSAPRSSSTFWAVAFLS